MSNQREKGQAGEDMAVDYLTKKGYRILQRNYRYEHGEIDIIAEDGAMLVFIEVKAFRSKNFGEPEDAVTFSKRERIRKTADGYIFESMMDERLCRFDVIAIDCEKNTPVIRHLMDAF
jgi:putative endonuclease